MTLELDRLAQVVSEMGRALAGQERATDALLQEAREQLTACAEQADALRPVASQVRAAIPTDEPPNAAFPLPSLPDKFTVIGADGSQIQPDRHGFTLYYLINIGSLVYRHGSGQTPEARSIPDLRYREEDLYDGPLLVADNLLDVRRDLAEITHLADLTERERPGDAPVLALADGQLLLWVLENVSTEPWVSRYLEQLERIRRAGGAVAAFTSRPRFRDVGRLLHLTRVGGSTERFKNDQDPLEHLPDRLIFDFLPAGSRSALFISPGPMNQVYRSQGHQVHFFYVNVADEEERPVVARVETPAWVVSQDLVSLVHGIVVAQSRVGGGFPYVLARADELAYISGAERERLTEMVGAALLSAGIPPTYSPKAFHKGLTRRGWRVY